jgi:hypothetical protein
MEITAAINALKATPEDCEVEIITESDYLINAMTTTHRRRANTQLLGALDDLVKKRRVVWNRGKVSIKSGDLPRALKQTEQVQQGVANYRVPDVATRLRIKEVIKGTFPSDEITAPLADWVLRVGEVDSHVRVTAYTSGTILVQGRRTELWDGVCTGIEGAFPLGTGEIASRFVSNSREESERYVRLISPKLIHDGEQRARSQLGAAFDYLEPHDRQYAITAFSLLLAHLNLPEYSAVVMPLSKAFEGFLVRMMLDLRLVTTEELKGGFPIGGVLDENRRPLTKTFVERDASRKSRLRVLNGELTKSRHYMMHSDGTPAKQVTSLDEAQTLLFGIADVMLRSHRELILKA